MIPSSANTFSHRAKRLLETAAQKAAEVQSQQVEPLHLLLALLDAQGSLGYLILRNLGIHAPKTENPEKETGKTDTDTPIPSSPERPTETLSPSLPGSLPFSSGLKKVIIRAFALAHQAKSTYVGTEHLAHALLELPSSTLTTLFEQAKIHSEDISTLSQRLQQFAPNILQLEKIFSLAEGSSPEQTSEESGTTYLDRYGIDFMQLPESDSKIQKLRLRTQEVDRMIHILGRHRKSNPLLIGEPGVGKTTLVYALAQRILDGSAGALLANKHIIGIDLAAVVAGTNFRGEFETRLKEIIREAEENPDIILFIDEIHTLVGAGNTSGGLDAANILKPALTRGNIQCIGATTLTEYKRSLEKDSALERRFQPITVHEPSPSETLAILKENRKQYERFHHLSLPMETLEAATELSVRYIPDRFLPDKALDLIDEASSLLSYQHQPIEILGRIRDIETKLNDAFDAKEKAINEEKYAVAERIKKQSDALEKTLKELQEETQRHFSERKLSVLPEHIAQVVARITHIPYEKLVLSPSERIIKLQEVLEQKIIGQTEPLAEIANALIRTWSGVSSPDRPLGSFLFLGPSGVGKTLTAKILASTLFENENALIRFDMSEFMERHTVAQMIGAPPGYVGFGDGGKLTEKVRRQPYSIVLFDEIEKAHPDIFNLLLQILDEGYLNDAEGRKVSFRNTVIILTSNIGTQAFNQNAKIGFRTSETVAEQSFETVREHVLAELKNRLRPELLGRLDHTIVFKPLRAEHFHTITEHELDALKRRVSKQKITLRIEPKVIDSIAAIGGQSPNSARLIRQKIQTLIETPLAKTLLEVAVRPITIVIAIENDVIFCRPETTQKKTLRKKPSSQNKKRVTAKRK